MKDTKTHKPSYLGVLKIKTLHLILKINQLSIQKITVFFLIIFFLLYIQIKVHGKDTRSYISSLYNKEQQNNYRETEHFSEYSPLCEDQNPPKASSRDGHILKTSDRGVDRMVRCRFGASRKGIEPEKKQEAVALVICFHLIQLLSSLQKQVLHIFILLFCFTQYLPGTST